MHKHDNIIYSRNDAGLAAAELALSVEKHVLDTRSIDTVGTTGISLELILVWFILTPKVPCWS